MTEQLDIPRPKGRTSGWAFTVLGSVLALGGFMDAHPTAGTTMLIGGLLLVAAGRILLALHTICGKLEALRFMRARDFLKHHDL